jgi:hypothetical protein
MPSGGKNMKLLSSLALVLIAIPALVQGAPAWRGYGGDEQHNAQAPAAGQMLSEIRWTAPVDLQPLAEIHYGSPMITEAGTVLFPVKTGETGAFELDALKTSNGKKTWSSTTDFVPPQTTFIPSFPAHLTAQNRLYYAGAGGTVYFRDAPDAKKGKQGQLAFFGLSSYRKNKATYDNAVMISTPITADDAGNIYFGFLVTGDTPLHLSSGIARIGTDGSGRWISVASASGDSNMKQVATNCAPAISRDQSTIYIAVGDGQNLRGNLLGLDSTTLKAKFKTGLIDPGAGIPAFVTDFSSASPTIGPDGDVFYGVYEAENHNCRGWLLHFDATLAHSKAPGSFGWDTTPSIVPAGMVPSYKGKSSYLLMSKYNNYLRCGTGDGKNEIAILDPNAKQKDAYSNVSVMKEVLTILSPHHVPGKRKGAVYEWCINSAVVDVQNNSVIANAEDGYTYRWDLTTNTLSQNVNLNPPNSQAYTPTIIAKDGTIFVINDGVLYALGN